MAEGTARGIDPRFDPRFQRGYVPTDEPRTGPVAGRVIENDGAPREGAAARKPSTADAQFAAFLDPGTPPPSAGFDDSLAVIGVTGSPAPASSTADAEDPESVDGSGSDASAQSNPWFGAGWVVAVLSLTVGASLWWTSILGENFSGPVPASGRWLQVVGWTVAPSLVEGGLIGIVLMLVWAGVRHARGEDAS